MPNVVRDWRLPVTAAASLALLLLSDIIGFSSWLQAKIRWVAQPGQQVFVTIQRVAEQPFRIVARGYRAGLRIQDLELRYSEAAAQVGQLQQLEIENQALRQMLENSDRTLQPSVITSPLVSFAKPAVGAGSKQNIRSGMPVILSGTLVGRITTVSEQSSEVALLNSREITPIVVRTETGVEGLVTGDGRRILLSELPADAAVQPGQQIWTVGQTGLPAGLFIGRVQSVESQPAEATQTAVIQQPVQFYQSRVVEIYQ